MGYWDARSDRDREKDGGTQLRDSNEGRARDEAAAVDATPVLYAVWRPGVLAVTDPDHAADHNLRGGDQVSYEWWDTLKGLVILAAIIGLVSFLVWSDNNDRKQADAVCNADLSLIHAAQDSIAYLRRHHCP